MRISIVAGLGLVIAALVIGLGPAIRAGAQAMVKQVAIVVPASRTDHGWNQQGPDSLERAGKALGLSVTVAENAGYSDITPILRDLSAKGAQLIICHASGYVTVCPAFAKADKVKVAIVDRPDAIVPNLISDIQTNAHEGAYLAGAIAGVLTKTNTVAIIVSGEPPTWNRMSVGFAEGLHSTRPNARLLYGVIGQAAYEDASGAKRLTEAQLAAGADIIFGMGDGASFGMMNAIAEYDRRGTGTKAWFIDVIGDKRDIDKDGVLLTSVLFDYTPVYEQMIKDIPAGKFGQNYIMNLANHGVGLLDLPAAIPSSARKAVDVARQNIVSGTVQVSLIGDTPATHQRLHQLFPSSVQ
jgi:basic membrane protein A and related proteins